MTDSPDDTTPTVGSNHDDNPVMTISTGHSEWVWSGVMLPEFVDAICRLADNLSDRSLIELRRSEHNVLDPEASTGPASLPSPTPSIREALSYMYINAKGGSAKIIPDNESVDAILALFIQTIEELSLDIIEPCEPECSPERHAVHEASWRAHLKAEALIERVGHG